METMYSVLKEQVNIMTGEAVQIREWLEEALLHSALGFSPMLQENEDDGDLEIYLHSEWTDELEDVSIDKAVEMGLNEYDSLDCIQHILGISIQPMRKEA